MNRSSIITAAAALGLGTVLSMQGAAYGTVIISDTFTTSGAGSTGSFALDTGVNRGINPPTVTRLTGTTGTLATGLRYINRNTTGKPDSSFRMDANARFRVNSGAQSGRSSLSADGTNAFDFGPAMGVGSATPANPLEYDITISMANMAEVLPGPTPPANAGTQRMSFGWGTVESDANNWDFGVQLYRALSADTTYTVQKRINTGSSGVANINQAISGIANATGSEVAFLIRVTDAGAESGSDFNSRVRVSIDGGTSWLYDTDLDTTALPNGFRFDGAGRFFSFDVAGGNSSFVTYDNFSITTIPEPGTMGLAAAAGMMVFARRRKA